MLYVAPSEGLEHYLNPARVSISSSMVSFAATSKVLTGRKACFTPSKKYQTYLLVSCYKA